MKKLIAALLCVTSILTLTACGGKETAPADKNENSIPAVTPDETLPPLNREPNEEEIAAIDRYYAIARSLETYERWDSFELNLDDNYYYEMDNETAKFFYEELSKLTVVDQFKNSDYCAQKNVDPDYPELTISWDRQTYLSKFKTYENILLGYKNERTDYVGNVSGGNFSECYLVVDGVLYEDVNRYNTLTKTKTYYSTPKYLPKEIFDENGKLVKIEYRENDRNHKTEIEAVCIPQYDENGLRVKDVVTTSDGFAREISYAYDQQNRLIQIQWNENQWDFTYDDKGNQIKQVYTEFFSGAPSVQEIYEYTYNDQGHVQTGKWTKSEYIGYAYNRYIAYQQTNDYVYTCDAQGNILSWTITYGHSYNMSGNNAGTIHEKANYVSSQTTLAYGDLMVYEKN